MYKLSILFSQPLVAGTFELNWQKFLGMVEKMPGLLKETVSDVEQLIVAPDNVEYKKIHELYFESKEALDAALASEEGQQAGQFLHTFTRGKFVLLTARHMEATPNEFKK